MARKRKETAKGEFMPKNPEKYQGTYPIVYRSSWEISVMMTFDENPFVVAWGSESIQIPYINAFKRTPSQPNGSWSIYIPDFWVVFYDKNGTKHSEMIEVKPLKETPGYVPVSQRTGKPLKVSEQTKMIQAINAMKWSAAKAWCAKNGFEFRVVTEETLYKNGRRS